MRRGDWASRDPVCIRAPWVLPKFDWTPVDREASHELAARNQRNGDAGGLVGILLEGPGRLVKHSLPIDAELRSRIARFFAEELPPLLELRR